MVARRRFQKPWVLIENAESFEITDANGFPLAYLYYDDDPSRNWASIRGKLTKDEARGVADLMLARGETRENWAAALRMIREAVETLGPPGALPSQDAVLELYGPEPVHEATAIVEALRKLLGRD